MNYNIFIQVKAQASMETQFSWNRKQQAQRHWGQHGHVVESTVVQEGVQEGGSGERSGERQGGKARGAASSEGSSKRYQGIWLSEDAAEVLSVGKAHNQICGFKRSV